MTESGRSFAQDLLRVTRRDPDSLDNAVVLEVSGELDLLSAPLLEKAVAAAFASEPELLVFDLTGVTFLASIGMTILLKAQRDATPNARIRVVAPERSVVARALALTGLLDALGVVPTVPDALAR